MAGKGKLSGSEKTSYTDFEPASERKIGEHVDTWILELPEFKKEQLKVQVNKDGILRVTGERPINNALGKKKRFIKETRIPENCDINEIRAKFMNNQLHITMPKTVAKQEPPPVAAAGAGATTSTSSEKPPRQEVADQKPKAQDLDASCSYDDRAKANAVFENERNLKEKKKVILWFGIAAVTMVAIGAFVASKYGSDYLFSSLYMDD